MKCDKKVNQIPQMSNREEIWALFKILIWSLKINIFTLFIYICLLTSIFSWAGIVIKG